MNGFFLGGVAQGADSAIKALQTQQQLDNTNDLGQKRLQLEQQAQQAAQQRFDTTRYDQIRTDGIKSLTDTITALKSSGATTQQILKSVSPWIDQLKSFSKRTGVDPVSAVDIPVQSILAEPSFNPVAVAGLITDSADKYGVPADILHNVLKQESGFNPSAVNQKSGAAGIAQFTPGTAASRGVDPMNPDSAVPGAASYLSDLRKQFGGNMGLALAAYNWGPGNVQSWIKNGADPSKMPKETTDYVQSVSGKPIDQWTAAPQQPANPQQVTQILQALNSPNVDKNIKAVLASKLAQIVNPSADVEAKVLTDENSNQHVVFINKAKQTVTGINGEPYVVPTGGESDASTIAKAIESGRQPPVLTGLYRKSAAVRAQLEKNGVDLSQLDLEYKSAVKQVQSLNGPQMVRYAGLAKSVINTIDEVNSLATELNNNGVPLSNRLRLQAWTQTQGNSEKGQLASRYLAAVNTLKEEFANLAQGGYAPTEAAWKLASDQINADYGVKQLGASLTEVQRLLRYRLNGIPNFNTLGPGGQNRYVNDAAGNTGHASQQGGAVDWKNYFGAGAIPPPPPGFVMQQ
jgi:hypothetical protein